MAKKSRKSGGYRSRASAGRKPSRRGFTPRAGSRASRSGGRAGVQRFVVQHVMQSPQNVMAPFQPGNPLSHYLQGLFSQNLPEAPAIPGFGGVPAAPGPVKVPDATRRKKSKL